MATTGPENRPKKLGIGPVFRTLNLMAVQLCEDVAVLNKTDHLPIGNRSRFLDLKTREHFHKLPNWFEELKERVPVP